MINFLRKIFQKEEKIEQISLNELEKLINSNAGYIVSQMMQDVKKIMINFNVKINKLHWAVEALKNSELQNPNIPMKAKQYMEGNREYYINSVLKWCDNIKYNSNLQFAEMGDFVNAFNKSIEELNKNTLKSFNVLQEFFANESGKIATIIKELNGDVKELGSKLNNQKLLDFEKTKIGIAEIRERIQQKERLEQEHREIEKNIDELKKSKDEIIKEVENFKKSESFANYKNLRQERESLGKTISLCEDTTTQSFSVIERALRKYSHIAFEHEQLVLSYIASPLSAMLIDKRLVILDILNKTKENLEKGVLKLEQAKREKSIEEIKKLNREFFTKLIEDYSNAMKKIKEIDKQIEQLNLISVMNGYNSKLNNIDFSIKNLEKEHSKLKENLDKIELNVLIAELENLIKNSFNEVKIKV